MYLTIIAILYSNEMPTMRGRDAVKALRDMNYTGIVIGVTANVLQSDIEDFVSQGANAVIKKPMSAEKLEVVLEEMRRSTGSRR
jgi:CheY-like chemotaxis protein